ncbi:MAG: DNA-directed RNA polymerase subunit beta', partial [Firmicutes bacterium]|nr:DNA-directed RNA polymerase subunit beta' [Bacillota bacterium]
IKLHPLVCTPFNADFDGDQMAVHVPLSVEAQAEARFLMLSVNNILAPKDGSPITTPTQDMILGSYYLTYPGIMRKVGENGKVIEMIDDFQEHDDGFERVPVKGDGKVFTDLNEMLMAYQDGIIDIHAKVKVRMSDDPAEAGHSYVESTVGRFIFNRGIPQDLGFVDRTKDKYGLEVNFLCGKKELGKIINKCFRKHENTGTILMLDYIKDTGYKYSTKAAVTISIDDMEIPEEKDEIVARAEKEVDKFERAFRAGLISNKERYEHVCKIWNAATDEVADALMDKLGPMNNLQIMAHSGARGSKNQIRQVGGMRGLMANATGKTVEVPITSNFREGLSILEYFISSNGARKGLADTALRTADSGYLTRRLVDVSHNVIVNEYDCGTDEYIVAEPFRDGKEEIETLKERIAGRTSFFDVENPETGEIIVNAGEEITDEQAADIEKAGVERVAIRSIMTCKSRTGVCAKCYGRNLATYEPVNIGEAVGIIAAQSIGEPGTQLTMRTFHSGGVAGDDIVGGLPRVEELFEARKPKGLAEICEADGEVISIEPRDDNRTEVIVREEGGDRSYIVAYGAQILVKVGTEVKAGDNITKGPLDPHDILRLKGAEGVHEYVVKEVKRVYKKQGVDINDKHIEVIVSQMLSKYKVENPGDTTLLPGSLYNKYEIDDANTEVIAEDKQPAEYKLTLQGITKAALAANSFLSAASFQETTKVLTDAAIKGKTDKLQGLKENVIIGKLIPAGPGMKRYRNVSVDYGVNAQVIEQYLEEQRRLREAELQARNREKESAEEAAAETVEEAVLEAVEETEEETVQAE